MIIKKLILWVLVVSAALSNLSLAMQRGREYFSRACKPDLRPSFGRHCAQAWSTSGCDEPSTRTEVSAPDLKSVQISTLLSTELADVQEVLSPAMPARSSSSAGIVAGNERLLQASQQELPAQQVVNQACAHPPKSPQQPLVNEEGEELVMEFLQELMNKKAELQLIQQRKKEIFALHHRVTHFMRGQLALSLNERQRLPQALQAEIRFRVLYVAGTMESDAKLIDLYTPRTLAALLDLIGLLFQDCFTQKEYIDFASWLNETLPFSQIFSLIDCNDVQVKSSVLLIATHAVRAKCKHFKFLAGQWSKYLTKNKESVPLHHDQMVKNGLIFLSFYFFNNPGSGTFDQACALSDHLKKMRHMPNVPVDIIDGILLFLNEKWKIPLEEPVRRCRAPRSLSDEI